MQEFVVPQDVKGSRLGRGSVAQQLEIVRQDSDHLFWQAGVWILVPSQFEKVQSRNPVVFRAVEFVAADQVQRNALGDQFLGQSENVRSVAASRQQGDRNITLGSWRPRFGDGGSGLLLVHFNLRAHLLFLCLYSCERCDARIESGCSAIRFDCGTPGTRDNCRSTAASTKSVVIKSMQFGTKSQVGL